jgi:hypothetical protein
MPQAWLCTARHHLRLALPWAGVLALSVSLAWAMTVGVTGAAQGAGGPPPSQSQPILEGALESDADTLSYTAKHTRC